MQRQIWPEIATRISSSVGCGFASSSARALLDRNPDPTDDEIRVAISGQICRCTGYSTIVRSIRWAAEHPD